MERRKRRGREAWVRIIGEQKRSGLSAAAYCRQEDIGIASFYQWKRELTDGCELEPPSRSETFIDMGRVGSTGRSAEMSEVRASSFVEVTVELGDGTRLIVRRG